MFERYTEGARRALFFARFAVSQHGADEIEPEHVLMGLLPPCSSDEPELDEVARLQQATTAARLLQAAVITRDAVEGRMKQKATPLPTSVEIPFSASAKRCLDAAMREANQMGASPITTGHLLLGLLQADGNEAASILRAGGLRIDAVRLRVEEDVAAGVEGEPPPTLPNEELA